MVLRGFGNDFKVAIRDVDVGSSIIIFGKEEWMIFVSVCLIFFKRGHGQNYMPTLTGT